MGLQPIIVGSDNDPCFILLQRQVWKLRLSHCIRKTCPCNVYPLEPHFYIAKLGYAGVYLFFLFLLQNIDCGYSLEPPQRGGFNVYPQSMFWSKNKKNIKIFLMKFSFFLQLKKQHKKKTVLHGQVFVMEKVIAIAGQDFVG